MVPRVPQCLSPRWNLDPPPPLPQASVPRPPLPEPKGAGRHTRLRVRGWRSPNSDDWRKKLSTPSTMGLMPICVNVFHHLSLYTRSCILICFFFYLTLFFNFFIIQFFSAHAYSLRYFVRYFVYTCTLLR